jgi:hypothetical protein
VEAGEELSVSVLEAVAAELLGLELAVLVWGSFLPSVSLESPSTR